MKKSSKPGFNWGKGKYYFTIKDSPRSITMFRDDKNAAVYSFSRYRLEGKEVEWHGCWDGKKFIETQFAEAS